MGKLRFLSCSFFYSSIVLLFSLAYSQSNEIDQVPRCPGYTPMVDTLQDGEYDSQKFLILHDIIIDKEKTMTLAAGTECLMAQNAAIRIRGTLVCSGTESKSILFRQLLAKECPWTTKPDGKRWAGIYVEQGGIVRFKHTIIRGSDYGIVIDSNNTEVHLDTVAFADNNIGKITLNSKPLDIPREGIVQKLTIHRTTVTSPDIHASPQKNLTTPKVKTWLRPPRVATAVFGSVSLGIAAGSLIASAVYNTQYQKATPTVTSLGDKRDRAALIGNACLMSGAVGFTAFSLTFLF